MKEKTEENLNYSLKLIVKTSFIVFIGLILSKVLTYGYRIIVAREFGPEMYGLLSLALIAVNWFTVFSFFGLDEGILRFFSFYRGKNETNTIKYLFRISMSIITFTSIFFAIFLFFFSGSISTKIFHNAELITFL